MITSVRFVIATALFATLLMGAAAPMVSATYQDASQSTSLEGVDSISISGVGQAIITIGSPPELTISGSNPFQTPISISIPFKDFAMTLPFPDWKTSTCEEQ